MTGDLDDIKTELQNKILDVCKKLLPEGEIEGDQWASFNPVENDYKKGRLPALKVRLKNGVKGAWKCWRCGEAGDVIKLIAYIERTNVKDALVWARDFLGIQAMSREERDRMRKATQKKAEAEKQDDDKRRANKLVMADRLFSCRGGQSRQVGPALVPLGTYGLGEGNPAEQHVRRYFAARSVPLEAAQHLNRLSFRVSPQTEWWKGAIWERDNGRSWKAEDGPLFPALHSAMRNSMGIVTACHVTFLDPLKPAKAPKSPAKLMYGEALGAVIEISTGPSGVPFWMADREGLAPAPLVIAEGIETALSFAVTIPEARVWAGGSLAGVGNAPIDMACVEWVLFARDNNSGNSQAQKQFAGALEKLEAHGKRVHVEASHVGDDFNDLVKGDE